MADEHIAYPNQTDSDIEDLTRNSDITAEQVKIMDDQYAGEKPQHPTSNWCNSPDKTL